MKDGTLDDLNVRKHPSHVTPGASLVVIARGQPVALMVPNVVAEARRFGCMKGQIAFLDPYAAISSDMAASIAAELDPPA